jgi:quercetin dioxygenase-like cupin family protein
MNLETITYNNERLAIILRFPYEPNGQEFVSDNKDYLQLGVMSLEQGRILKPHIHKSRNEYVPITQEALIMFKGRMRVDFYYEKKKVNETILNAGDIIVLLSGGHGFEVLSKTKLVEIKQGQYIDQKMDKEYI